MNESQTKLLQEVLFETNYGSMEFSLKPKHPKIKKAVYGIINAMGKANTFSEYELVNTAATFAWETINGFHLVEGASWDAMADGSDKLNLNRLIKTVVTKLEHELPPIINPNTKRMYDPETGGSVFVNIDFQSLDAPVYDDEEGGEVATVGDSVTESLFASQADYVANPFLAWFRANRHDFLTKRQNRFIDSMSVDSAKDSDYIEECDFEELVGMARTNLSNMKQRIYQKTMAAWKKAGISRRETYLLGEIAKYRELLALAESDDDLAGQNAILSAWIAGDEDAVEIGYGALAGDRKATQVYVSYLKGEANELDAHVLYDICEAIEMHVERMKAELEAYEPSAPIMQDEEAKETNAMRKERYKEFAGPQPCHVFSIDGEYLRTIQPVKASSYKIVNLNTYGMRNEIKKEGN
ncbi:hypothetical protein [Rossellomorea marisflavi]|uniref:hypothetical protein n=1 Tax=Rossellomorea marisflavi TaxID=189381 RepID=UPI003D2F0135